ncbi:MAG TPA: glycoside hydrolase family 57 [Deltaproteobacteria bacterium]|nr:glycoside hydrolase family 57 [Deltaproteobacteria bacterium]
MLYLYSIFHCNLSFSSIPEADYGVVARRCYAPLLDMAEEGLPLALEATASTLVELSRIDPAFVDRLGRLWEEGRCEFVGSGYSQIIMPLVPCEVNRWNLDEGNRLYRGLLGRAPETVLVNEQTFSAGLVDLYSEAGYRSLVMDWANCHRFNRYPRNRLYYPQLAKGLDATMNVIWNHSIAFQKFQRAVHGELPLEGYMDFLLSHYDEGRPRGFILYGNDAEVFDYRPGAGATGATAEYGAVRSLMRSLAGDGRFELVTPSQVLSLLGDEPEAMHPLALQSPETPVVCKKQEKYNPLRWAVTGRDDVHINTACYRIYEKIRSAAGRLDGERLSDLKRKLCTVWGSDLRTNTVDEKFQRYRDLLGWLMVETSALGWRQGGGCARAAEPEAGAPAARRVECAVESDGGLVRVRTGAVEAAFIEAKGLALESLSFPGVWPAPLIGTIAHGHFDDIALGADFFSCHLIHVARDGAKTTDLAKCRGLVEEDEETVTVSVSIPLAFGTLRKRYTVWRDEPRFAVTYGLAVAALGASSLRLGIFTFLPWGFDRARLWYETVNGGPGPERFALAGRRVEHDRAVSPLVTASSCLGATDGTVRVGDDDKCVAVTTDKSGLYTAPMLNYREVDDGFFLRLYHSVGEVDDTAYWTWRGTNEVTFTVTAAGR